MLDYALVNREVLEIHFWDVYPCNIVLQIVSVQQEQNVTAVFAHVSNYFLTL